MPLGMIWTEAVYCQRRVRSNAVMNAVLIHAAIVDAIAGNGHLKRVIEKVEDE